MTLSLEPPPARYVADPSEYAQTLQERLKKCLRDNLGTAAERQKEYYNCRVYGEPYQEGDYVWLHNPAIPRGQSKKLFCPWVGPFKVVKCLSDSVYRVQDTRTRRKCQVFHFDRLKRCHAPPSELRTDSLSDTQNLAPEVNLRNESDDSEHLTLPGTNLELVEDDDDLTINLTAIEIS